MTGIQVYSGKPVTSTQKGIGLRPSPTGCREGGGGQRRRRATGPKPGKHLTQRDPFEKIRVVLDGDPADRPAIPDLQPEVATDRNREITLVSRREESFPEG